MLGITRFLHGYPIPARAMVLLTFCFFVILGCGAQKLAVREERPKEAPIVDMKPSWTLSGKHPAYPHPLYILGVGLAKGSGNAAADRQLADQNAFSEIARQIFAQVSSEISVERLEVIGDKVETILGRTIADSRVQTSLTVSGLTIAERYYDPNEHMFYSLGILDRTVASAPYRSALLRHQTDYQNHLREAEQHRQTGKIFQSLFSLREAFHAAFRYQEVLPSFELLAAPDAFNELEFSEPPSNLSVLNKLTEIFSGLQLRIVEGDKQEFIVGKPLPLPLTVRLTLAGEIEAPIENVPVNFHFEAGQGDILTTVRTNTKGLASSIVKKVERSPAKLYMVAAELDLRELADTTAYAAQWNQRLSAGERKVLFQLARKRATTATKVLILVDQSNRYPARTSLAQEVLSQELSHVGLSPVTKADIGSANAKMVRSALQKSQFAWLRNKFPGAFEIIIAGEISVQPLSEVQGMKIFSANGLVKAVSLETGLSLGSETFQDLRGFGITEQQAAENAIRTAASKAAETIIGDILSTF